MLQEFLDFVVSCWKAMIQIFQQTKVGGITFEFILVSVMLITIISRVVLLLGKD